MIAFFLISPATVLKCQGERIYFTVTSAGNLCHVIGFNLICEQFMAIYV